MARYIKPEDWPPLEEGAFNTHKITVEKCEAEGVPIKQALEEMDALAEQASLFVAHQLQFDMRLINRESFRLGFETKLRKLDRYCTMHRPGCNHKLPKKLSEMYHHLTGKRMEQLHNAVTDIEMTRECYFLIRNLSIHPSEPLI